MKIHEYQAKEILREFNVPLPKAQLAHTPEEALKAAEALGGFPVVVKAQVHVGGRGKAGGVKLAKNAEEVAAHAKAILGMSIKGITVKKILIEAGVDIDREIYAGVILDRKRKAPVMMFSAAGGVDIEDVAATTPERILYMTLEPGLGLQEHQIRRAIYFLDIPAEAQKGFALICRAMERSLMLYDASLVEINPLVITGANEIIACDCKMNFDDNALMLHPQLESLRDLNEEEPLEVQAREAKISYVKLEGKIGCLVNGAGLAMGTMDIVKHFGGEPANFLDVGGGAKPETIAEALRIITSDKTVNTIFFNIFGGIVRCDRVAEGVLKAKEVAGINLPIVMRLVGTNEDKAREMLEGTDLIMLPTMSEAAKKAVELSKRA